MARSSFRVGKVKGYLRGQVWYLCYHENGRRLRPRVGTSRAAARQQAAQVNAQLEVGVPSAFDFEPLPVPDLRDQWLRHHESVLRSSVHTIHRYRTATDHLLRFLQERPVGMANLFRTPQAAAFAHYLRTVEVAPNGHPHARKRRLLDKGVKFILETCRALFAYAMKRRHLSPYADNPFADLDLERVPVEDAKPIVLFDEEQTRRFLEACDSWQLPIFLTLLLTGLRPGELSHLLWPEDLNLEAGILRVRNKQSLGWRVKTRNERDIPLVPVLVEVLRHLVRDRREGPVFLRRRFTSGDVPAVQGALPVLERRFLERLATLETAEGGRPTRTEIAREARRFWRDAGGLKIENLRLEFMGIAQAIGVPQATAPKALRHMFATALQDANVDPLIRSELMGHSTTGRTSGGGLGMTGTYTHTRPETRRRQLETALENHPGTVFARNWLQRKKAEYSGENEEGRFDSHG